MRERREDVGDGDAGARAALEHAEPDRRVGGRLSRINSAAAYPDAPMIWASDHAIDSDRTAMAARVAPIEAATASGWVEPRVRFPKYRRERRPAAHREHRGRARHRRSAHDAGLRPAGRGRRRRHGRRARSRPSGSRRRRDRSQSYSLRRARAESACSSKCTCAKRAENASSAVRAASCRRERAPLVSWRSRW